MVFDLLGICKVSLMYGKVNVIPRSQNHQIQNCHSCRLRRKRFPWEAQQCSCNCADSFWWRGETPAASAHNNKQNIHKESSKYTI